MMLIHWIYRYHLIFRQTHLGLVDDARGHGLFFKHICCFLLKGFVSLDLDIWKLDAFMQFAILKREAVISSSGS